MTDERYRFQGVVKSIKHIESHTENSDSEDTVVTLLNKMGDKIMLRAPTQEIRELFFRRQEIVILFVDSNEKLQ